MIKFENFENDSKDRDIAQDTILSKLDSKLDLLTQQSANRDAKLEVLTQQTSNLVAIKDLCLLYVLPTLTLLAGILWNSVGIFRKA